MAARLWRLDVYYRHGDKITKSPYYFHPFSADMLKGVCKIIKRQSYLRLESVHLYKVAVEEVPEPF